MNVMTEGRMRIPVILHSAYGTDPVKLTPAKSGEFVTVSPNTGPYPQNPNLIIVTFKAFVSRKHLPSQGTKFTTPGGMPTSFIIWNIV